MTVSREAPRHADLELELLAAASPFLRLRRRVDATPEALQRFRRALVELLRARGHVPHPEAIATAEDALEALRAIVARCEELRVPWPDVVAIVNREARFPSDAADPRRAA